MKSHATLSGRTRGIIKRCVYLALGKSATAKVVRKMTKDLVAIDGEAVYNTAAQDYTPATLLRIDL